MGATPEQWLTLNDLSAHQTSQIPMQVAGVGLVQVSGLKVTSCGQHVTVHGQLVGPGNELGQYVGFTAHKGTVTVDERYPAVLVAA